MNVKYAYNSVGFKTGLDRNTQRAFDRGGFSMSEVHIKGKAAKEVSYSLVNITTDQKNRALALIAEQLETDQNYPLLQKIRRTWTMEKRRGLN